MRSLIALLSFTVVLLLGCQSQAGSEPRESQRRPYAGEPVPAPPFKLKDVNGKTFSLSDFKGKVVFLDFWATWCPPCVMSTPAVQQLTEKYKDVVVISISLDTETEPVKKFASKHGFHSRVALAGDSGVDVQYRIQSIPCFFLVDQSGNIVRIWQGYSSSMAGQWQAEIDRLLGV